MERDLILIQINALKVKLGALWDERGKTDKENLDLSVEIDDLINIYYRTPDNLALKLQVEYKI